MDSIVQLLISSAYIFPFFLIYSLGIILALINKNIPKKNARLALFGFILLMSNTLINFTHILWIVFLAGSSNTQTIITASTISGIITTIFAFIGTILLIAAIFVKRDFQDQ